MAPTNAVSVFQSSIYDTPYPASNAIDGNPATFTHTLNYTNSYWMADLGATYPIGRVEIVNRTDCCAARLGGLVLRIFDGASNSVASAILPNPGLGGTWTNTPAPGTMGRYVRVGLENGQTNADGNYYVTLAEARVYSGTTNLLVSASASAPITNNLASFKPSYMVRLTTSVPAATNANDDKISTETKTTTQTVDGYWEVDLGATWALYGVRTIGASGIGSRLTNTFVRLFDGAHDSVFAQRLSGTPDVFDSDLNGPWFARFVRVGLEDKQRTDPAGGLEWYIGMREVEVFGRPTNGVGILAFNTSAQQVVAGQPITLSWNVEDVRRVEIRPAPGSVGAYTATSGAGSIMVTPTNSTEYFLIASNFAGLFTRATSVQVGSTPLSVRLSEIVADNKYSLRDGYGDAPDWIELRNTGNSSINLAGYGLSDDLAQPMKWIFPSTNLAAHATLIVFASGRDTPFDPAGSLHANFRLDNDGGALALTAPDGTNTVDLLASYPALDTDLAYGRDLEGNWTFMEPTPGSINTALTYAGWLRPLSFSHARGFYETPFTLTISNSNPGAIVFFSLDGSAPSIAYSSGISVANTKAVRAQVVRAGYKPARIQTETFIFIDNVIASPVMNTAITQDPRYAPRMRPGLLALPTISLV
ncbi:MAG TPA: discoidin domain-containing protein, partial [Verrucomicrobiae bacterium]|nr:discoidin domain-containing protein [Verrucomicrobiae bacterium]